MTHDVVLVKTEPRYPLFPYPSEGSGLAAALRGLWSAWGKDPENPFGEWLAPGGHVVMKPNWVQDYNPIGHDLDSLITHSSLIKFLIDACAVALRGKGSITIGDAPLQLCDFSRLVQQNGIQEVVANARCRYPGIDVTVEDWRLTLFERRPGLTDWAAASPQALRQGHDELVAEKYQLVDLGRESFLEEIADYADRFRVTCYQPSLMTAHHRPGKHEYLVTKRVFDADLLINLPKMKTHIKAGLTGALKNLVGINGHKEYLPHHLKGSYFQGGDGYCVTNRFATWYDVVYDRFWEQHMQLSPLKRQRYATLLRLLLAASRATGGGAIAAGSWIGNETIWRTTLDLNHILHFSPRSSRQIITIADGVLAGEGEGPLTPTPKPAGILLAGENPAYVDAVMARLMGYNISRVPTVYHALYHRKSRFAGPSLECMEVTTLLEDGLPESIPFQCLPNYRFVKPKYWRRAEAGAFPYGSA
jgi:uncharacterized protein (DUF362 family)